jgi:hypothetical protein
MNDAVVRPFTSRKAVRRVEIPAGVNESICIDFIDKNEAIRTCLFLTREGHDPRLYKLDSNGDGLLIATFELVK